MIPSGKVPFGPAEERETIIRRPAERALRVTAGLPREGWLWREAHREHITHDRLLDYLV